MMRSCRGERVKERGRMPAMNDLSLSVPTLCLLILRKGGKHTQLP
jgi:hypothetical protein